MDDLRVVYVKVKGEQEMVNAVIDTGAQMPVVRPDVVEGQSINNRGSIQITSAFGEHEMGEVKDSNMELNDFRHGVVPVSKNLVNDMLICSSDYEVLIENSQMIRNPAKLREPSKKEGIISSTDSKSVCSQEVVTDLLPETQSLLNVPNGDLVAVKINGSNVQTNGQESNFTLWFQQDGATCHTARATIDLLKDTFGDRLISRFGPVNWPPRSCDLTTLDYFLWGYVKSLVYADKPQTLDHLEDNIRRVSADIRPQMLDRIHRKLDVQIGLHPSQPWQSYARNHI
ncbi:putative LOC100569746 [Trichonephila clavipes]|nr:putative LOC100569746 [Trichonephila clavipes]